MLDSFWHEFSQHSFSGYWDIADFIFVLFSNGRWWQSWNTKLQIKNQNGFMQINVTQSCNDYTEFLHFTFIFSSGNHFDWCSFIKIWNKLMQESFCHKYGQNQLSDNRDIAIFMFCAFSVTSAGGDLESQISNSE